MKYENKTSLPSQLILQNKETGKFVTTNVQPNGIMDINECYIIIEIIEL